MSMTREEAIDVLRSLPVGLLDLTNEQKWDLTEAIDLALAALRFPTREMVERMFPGCGHCTKQKAPFCYDGANDSVYLLIGNGIAAIESDSWEFPVSYCPNCGRPLTDEAVDMMLERWKEAVSE